MDQFYHDGSYQHQQASTSYHQQAYPAFHDDYHEEAPPPKRICVDQNQFHQESYGTSDMFVNPDFENSMCMQQQNFNASYPAPDYVLPPTPTHVNEHYVPQQNVGYPPQPSFSQDSSFSQDQTSFFQYDRNPNFYDQQQQLLNSIPRELQTFPCQDQQFQFSSPDSGNCTMTDYSNSTLDLSLKSDFDNSFNNSFFIDQNVQINPKEKFDDVNGRLCLLSNCTKYTVSIGEILRRINPPETLHVSLLNGMLRKGKAKDNGKRLRSQLDPFNIHIPSGRRKTAPISGFTALVEMESMILARDFHKILVRDGGIFAFASDFIIKVLFMDCGITFETIYQTRKFLSSVMEDLSHLPEDPGDIVVNSEFTDCMNYINLMTHGFGHNCLRACFSFFNEIITETEKALLATSDEDLHPEILKNLEELVEDALEDLPETCMDIAEETEEFLDTVTPENIYFFMEQLYNGYSTMTDGQFQHICAQLPEESLTEVLQWLELKASATENIEAATSSGAVSIVFDEYGGQFVVDCLDRPICRLPSLSAEEVEEIDEELLQFVVDHPELVDLDSTFLHDLSSTDEKEEEKEEEEEEGEEETEEEEAVLPVTVPNFVMDSCHSSTDMPCSGDFSHYNQFDCQPGPNQDFMTHGTMPLQPDVCQQPLPSIQLSNEGFQQPYDFSQPPQEQAMFQQPFYDPNYPVTDFPQVPFADVPLPPLSFGASCNYF